MQQHVEYLKMVHRPQRLAAAIGETRTISVADARRLSADGFVRLVAAPPAAPPAPAPTVTDE